MAAVVMAILSIFL